LRPTDVIVLDGESVVVFTPIAGDAEEWFTAHLPEECPHLGAGYEVERRQVVKRSSGCGGSAWAGPHRWIASTA
jgi:hypothetical protein